MTVRAWCNEQALVIDGSCGESFELVLAQPMHGNCQILDHAQLKNHGEYLAIEYTSIAVIGAGRLRARKRPAGIFTIPFDVGMRTVSRR